MSPTAPPTRCPTCKQLHAGTGRCPECERARDKARGTRQRRGYDKQHDRLRVHYQQRMDAGERFQCWRCEKTIDAQHWHLGHDDHDRSRHRGPECPACNLATSGRKPRP